MEKIDFVITWLDGSDPKWLAEKRKWEYTPQELPNPSDDSNAECRYRADPVMLRYWFRSVERFAPWANKVFFVTCGQKPDWLNESHPKLVMVNHEDFIPSRYLPTFNSITIEMNFHRIAGLSERFVFFNDDMFLLQPVDPEFFFRDGCPVIEADLRYTQRIGFNNWSRILFNDYCIVNNSFDVEKSIWKNRKKWFSVSALGRKRARKNFLCYLANRTIPVSTFGHLPSAQLKSTLEEIWEMHPDVMEKTCAHKFRADDQVNQWLLSAWNLAKGCFFPTHERSRGKFVNVSPGNIVMLDAVIRQQSYPQICINDSQDNTESDRCSEVIASAMETILPNRSLFEKYE